MSEIFCSAKDCQYSICGKCTKLSITIKQIGCMDDQGFEHTADVCIDYEEK